MDASAVLMFRLDFLAFPECRHYFWRVCFPRNNPALVKLNSFLQGLYFSCMILWYTLARLPLDCSLYVGNR